MRRFPPQCHRWGGNLVWLIRTRTWKPGGRPYAPTRTNDHISDAPGDQRVCHCWSKQRPHCKESWLLNLDCTQMATTIHAPGPCRLQIAYGPSDHWSTEYLSQGIKRTF